MKASIQFDINLQYKTISGSPILADLPIGTYQVFRNTVSGDLELWGNNNGVIEQIVGGGGSQTLDQTLALGNVTDVGILFDTRNINAKLISIKPINNNQSTQLEYNIIRSATAQVGSDDNEVVFTGFNLDGGGGKIVNNLPSIGESLESNYYGIGPNNRMLEKHEIFYATNSQDQQRLSSYTITETPSGTSANIDFYHKVDKFYIYKPYTNNVWFNMQPTMLQMFTGTGSLDNVTFQIDDVNDIFYIHNQGIGNIKTLQFLGWDNISFPTNSNVTGINISTSRTPLFSLINPANNIEYTSLSYQENVGYDITRQYISTQHKIINSAKLITYDPGISGTYSIEGTSGVNMLIASFTNFSILPDVVIGDNNNIESSAKLEVKSTTKGFLPPRMTATQASAISSPAEGLMIYVTDTNGTFTTKGWWGWNGSAWERLNN